MKTFLVVNPNSANGQTGKQWPELKGKIESALGTVEAAFTERPMDAARLATKAIQAGSECIVAVGGDGTINEVINGFFENGRALNPNAALGVISRGTGGDFRRTFGWDVELAPALKRLQGEHTEPLDVGMIDYCRHDGERASRYFVNVCSFGVSGLVDKVVNSSSKVLGGKLSFMLGSTRALMQYRDQRVRFSSDGGASQAATVTTLAIANGKYFGGGMKVAPEASPSDGFFDVTEWSGYGLLDFALKSKSIYSGEHVKWKGTKTWRCKSLEASSDEEVLLDIDGEQPGRLPCSITMLPGAIRLKT